MSAEDWMSEELHTLELLHLSPGPGRRGGRRDGGRLSYIPHEQLKYTYPVHNAVTTPVTMVTRLTWMLTSCSIRARADLLPAVTSSDTCGSVFTRLSTLQMVFSWNVNGSATTSYWPDPQAGSCLLVTWRRSVQIWLQCRVVIYSSTNIERITTTSLVTA